jgi:hypothetical protein
MLKKMNLGDLKGAFNATIFATIKPLLLKFLPMLLGDVFRMQEPVEKGGLKKEEDDGIISVITTVGDQIILSVHPFNFVETDGFGEGPFLRKPIKSTNLTELVSTHLGIDLSEIHDNIPEVEVDIEEAGDTPIIQFPKDEEE